MTKKEKDAYVSELKSVVRRTFRRWYKSLTPGERERFYTSRIILTFGKMTEEEKKKYRRLQGKLYMKYLSDEERSRRDHRRYNAMTDEEKREYNHQRYERNKEKYKERAKSYAKNNRERYNKACREYDRRRRMEKKIAEILDDSVFQLPPFLVLVPFL